jgi:membrane associated rhomboid family serine protease
MQSMSPTPTPKAGFGASVRRSFAESGTVIGIPVALMWLVELIDRVVPGSFSTHGIRPLRLSGLDGIAWAPFLHVGFPHLIGNTVPFIILGLAIALRRSSRFVSVFVLSAIGSGIGTWLTGGRNTVHLGMSGVVFGLLGYLLARGAFDRKPLSILIGLGALFWYGSMLWGVLPRQEGVSWQAHLFGFLAGVAAARILDGRRPVSTKSV